MLRRLEWTSIAACVVMALASWIVAGGAIAWPLGVMAGGALVAISYRGIKGGIDAVVGVVDRGPGGTAGPKVSRISVAIGLVKFFTRYAILAAAAYVILARLRLPPVAVFVGASSLVVAVMFEAVLSFRSNPSRNVD